MDYDNIASRNDADELAEAQGVAWGGPYCGQTLLAYVDPSRLFVVEEGDPPGVGVFVADGLEKLRELGLTTPDTQHPDGLRLHPRVLGRYTWEPSRRPSAPDRYRYVDFASRRWEGDSVLDFLDDWPPPPEG